MLPLEILLEMIIKMKDRASNPPPSEIYSTMSVMNSRSKEVGQNWMTGNCHQ